MRRTVRVIAIVLGAVLACAAPASATPELKSSKPAPESVLEEGPTRIELGFGSPATFPAGAVRLLDENGAVIAASEKTPRGRRIRFGVPGVGEASYVVDWMVLDDAGTPSSGSFSFHVGDAPVPPVVPPPPVLERTAEDELRDLARTLTIVGGIVLAAAAAAFVLRRRRPEAPAALAAGQSALACTILAAGALLLIGAGEDGAPASAPGEHVARLGDGSTAKVNITPPRAGSPRLELEVTTAGGQPDFGLDAAKLRLVPLDGRIGPLTAELPKRRPGYFEPELLTVPYPGRWRVELSLLRSGEQAERVVYDQEIER